MLNGEIDLLYDSLKDVYTVKKISYLCGVDVKTLRERRKNSDWTQAIASMLIELGDPENIKQYALYNIQSMGYPDECLYYFNLDACIQNKELVFTHSRLNDKIRFEKNPMAYMDILLRADCRAKIKVQGFKKCRSYTNLITYRKIKHAKVATAFKIRLRQFENA